ETDIHVLSFADGAITRLTSGGRFCFSPVWSPDGRRVAYGAQAGSSAGIFIRPADGGEEKRVLETDLEVNPTSWSPDGKLLALLAWDTKKGTKYDVWLMPADGGKVEPLLATDADEGPAAFSSDGHWLTYSSDESGRSEIYVRPLPGPGSPSRISP